MGWEGLCQSEKDMTYLQGAAWILVPCKNADLIVPDLQIISRSWKKLDFFWGGEDLLIFKRLAQSPKLF